MDMARAIGLGVVALLALAGSAARAQTIHPKLLHETIDTVEGGMSVQDYIDAFPALTADSGAVAFDESILHTGDQIADRSFAAPAGVTMKLHWQSARFAPRHRIGWYPVADPSEIHWVLGGNATGLGTAGIAAPSSEFGLVLDAGNIGLNLTSGNVAGNHYFYSQPMLNTDSMLSSSIPSLHGFDRRNHVAVMQDATDPGTLILAWEDYRNTTPNRYLDYNDLGMTMSWTEPVPEPIGLVGLSVGLVGLWGRRRRRN